MRIRNFLFFSFVTFLVLPVTAVRAQDSLPGAFASDEDRASYALKSNKYGAVALEVAPSLAGCEALEITVSQKVDGAWQHKQLEGTRWLLTQKITRPRVLVLAPGEHLITSVLCGPPNTIRGNYRGPFAKFNIRAGELVNVGKLRLDFKMNAKGGIFNPIFDVHKSVVPFDAADRDYYKKELPRSLSRMTTRHMTLVGATDVVLSR
jgi:hypothetical protein